MQEYTNGATDSEPPAKHINFSLRLGAIISSIIYGLW